jgi:hypothetical protein
LNTSSTKNLASLVQSSRIFEELKCGYDEDEEGEISHFIEFNEVYLVDPKKFNRIAEFVKFTGPHIKKLLQ